jgi:glycosyltransferase involved in cell wall biosynthesis
MKENNLQVSLVIPVRNEKKYIERCVNSLLSQDYPKDLIEILFVDGRSEDGTLKALCEYQNIYPFIKVLSNNEKVTPKALNVGIKKAKGEYIIRLDAHATYSPDYVSQCIECANKTGAENVGGVLETVGEGYVGKAIACALSSPFGVGDSKYRTEQFEGHVDTVPFGCFKRSIFDKIGYFNEELTRNQDIEFNSRIRRTGGKIFLTPKIKACYYCRNSLAALWKQNFANGYWNIKTILRYPGSLSLRHFAPLIFILSLIILGGSSLFLLAAKVLFILDITSYIVASFLFSMQAAYKKGFKYLLVLPIVFAVLHFSYGLGSLWALLRCSWGEENR